MADEPPAEAGPQPFGGPHDTPPPASRPYAEPNEPLGPQGQPPPGSWLPPPGGWPPPPPPPPGGWATPPPGGWPPPPPGYWPPGTPPPWVNQAPPPPPDPVLDEAARRAGRHAVVYAVVGFILPFILIPLGVIFLPAALAVDIGALYLAIRARRAARKVDRAPAAAIVATVMASMGIAFVIAAAAVTAVFWNEINDYRQCSEGANTHVAKDACQQTLSDDVMRRLGL